MIKTFCFASCSFAAVCCLYAMFASNPLYIFGILAFTFIAALLASSD